MTPAELAALKALVVAEEARQTGAATALSDSKTADSDGVLQPQEDAMYSWISPKSYDHYGRRKVVFRDLQGRMKSRSFTTEADAEAWRTEATRHLVVDGRAAEKVLAAFLEAYPGMCKRPPKASTMTTVRFRLASFFAGRERVSIEAFPWALTWRERVGPQAGASQVGILSTLRKLVAFAGLPAKVLADCRITAVVKHGKEQLTLDEARRFIAAALTAGDPLAMAAATMVVVGCRPGEVLAVRARDVDDGGNLLHIRGTKTEAAKRPVPVDPAFVPVMLGLAAGLASEALLFDFEPQRHRASKDAAKAKRDALMRRVAQLCKTAGVPKVVPHSLRGLNATLRKTGGATDDSITRALGHVDISTTRRSYFAPGVAEQADAKRAFGRLLPASKAA